MVRKRKNAVAQGPVQGKWDLPAGWEWKRLGEVVTTSSGGTPSRKSPEFFGGTIPWLKSGELNDAVVSEVEEHITQQALNSSSAKVFPKGTLCIALYGATVGKLGFLGIDAATNQAVCAIFPQRIDSHFLFYYLLMQRQSLIVLGQGGAQPNISQTILSEFSTPLPPTLEDQKRIVERIDSLFAELDKAEETLRHTITLCEQYKQAVLKAAVTGELSKEWRKANPPKETGEQLLQRILKERRAAWEKAELAKMAAKGQAPTNDNWKKKYKEPKAPDTSGLPELPEGWTWANVDALSLEVQYGTSKKTNDDASGVPVLRMGNIVDGNLTWDKLKYLPESEDTVSLLLNNGDLLFNRTNSLELVGKTAVFNEKRKAIFASYLIRVVPCGINPEILSSYINSAIGREWIISVASQQVGQANVNGSKLKQLLIPVPPQKEQHIICNKIQYLLENKANLFKWIQNVLTQTTALRQSILKQAFTGQII